MHPSDSPFQQLNEMAKPNPKPTLLTTGLAGGIGLGFLSSFLASSRAAQYHTIYIIHPSFPSPLKTVLATAPKEHSYEIIELDLSCLSDVRKTAEGLRIRVEGNEFGRIKGMLLLAGAMFLDWRTEGGVSFTEVSESS